MKLICTQENFRKAIFEVERIVSKQNTLPILNNILFEAEKGALRLEATNLEIGIVAKIPAKVEKEGRITIPAKLISSFTNNMPHKGNVVLEVNDKNLKIKSEDVTALIKGLDAADFPLIPKKNTEFILNIPAGRLKSIISKVMVAVAFSEMRQELTGINLILGATELFFASTDSFRLTEHRFKLEEGCYSKEFYNSVVSMRNNIIIPSGTLIELNRILPLESKSGVKIAIEEGQIFFEFDDTRVVSRLINGKYPEYKHIMPPKYATRITGDKSMFISSVKMASIFASAKSPEITLKIDSQKKKVTIEGRSVETGENTSELDFDVEGPSLNVVFNSKYLLDGINTISSDQIAIMLNNSSTPAALKEIDQKTGEVLEEYLYIVMPIKQ